jgi:acyl carrier protein
MSEYTTGAHMAFDVITEQIISVVFPRLGLDETEVRTALEDGMDVPIDSILMVEALLDLEAIFGIQFPHDKETARALGSLPALAALIHRLREAQWAAQKGA